MASSGLNDELSCSICLSIYRNPVMLPCGHNFCESCIASSLNCEQRSGSNSCPECRTNFKQRPVLQKNFKLRNIVEHYLSAQPKKEKAEVFCTYCVTSPVPAVKTCLHCEASLCSVHLGTHSRSEKHILIEPTASAGDKKCLIHNELLEFFCSQDSSVLCMTCTKDRKHKGHRIEPTREAFEKKKMCLNDFVKNINLRLNEKETHLLELQKQKKKVQGKASDIKERLTAFFGDIKKEVLTLEDHMLNEVTRQEEEASLPISKLIKKLEIENADLRARKCHIEEMHLITDPLTLLKQPVINTDLGKRCFKKAYNNEDIDEELIAVTLQRGLSILAGNIPKLKTSRGFLIEDASDMILNVNTADINIALSSDLKNASYCHKEKSRPHHPERFSTLQVLSTKKFSSGQHYWEVRTGNAGDWSVGVTYNSVKRKGDTSHIGGNDKSWCLTWADNELKAEHDDELDDLDNGLLASPIGIYLDYDNGSLSFYELSWPVQHLHTFSATFIEPLHAAFYIDEGSWIHIGK
ncbi:hypothetical protein GDO86_003875 [Hymenochirus boettgeri]|uniref:Uncharacterized protein n=1 Tax=Hymenochirus boettgeri TaxID=247094 RepID=A0A8T2K906_9PIPI|nr:hypothetical protein GDO86_003875 [Hymenochirus boettgeri]